MRRVLGPLENLLRRYPWAITLVTLVPCAFFAARGSNALLAAQLFKADTDSLARPLPEGALNPLSPAPESSVTNHHVRDRTAVIHRNVFDSDAGCLDCDAGSDGGAEDGAGGGPAGTPSDEDLLPPAPCDNDPAHSGRRHPEACESQAKVIGAVASDDPLWSFVFVQPTGNGAAMPFRVGQTIDTRTVGTISWCRPLGAYVLLRPSGGSRCFLAQQMPPRAAPPPQPAMPTAAPPSGGGELASALDQGIERAGANEFNVRRSTVDRILENQAELMRTTRIMPVEVGGRVVGVQLFGVRGNSLLGRLGMQNGDTLNRLNGLDIASPDRALEAYSRLRSSDHIQVSLTRNGQPVNIDFNIR